MGAPRLLYFIQAGEDGPIKIGTSRDPGGRLKQLQTAHPETLRLLAVIAAEGEFAEAAIHRALRGDAVSGEWFRDSSALRSYIDAALAGDAGVGAVVGRPRRLPSLWRAWRQRSGLTQAEAAGLVGVSQPQLSAIERGGNTSVRIARGLVAAYGVSMAEAGRALTRPALAPEATL